MTLAGLNTSSLDSHGIVREFRDRVKSQTAGFLTPPTPACPRDGVPTEGFVKAYTFDTEDLLSRMKTEVVVHHGALPAQIASRLHFLYQSSPVIYAHRECGPLDLSVGQIRELIEGTLADRRAPGSDEPTQLLCHTGLVQHAVFRAIAAQSFGTRHVRSDLSGAASYEALAVKASERADSLVFGLRPEFAPRNQLRLVSIEGMWPGAPVNRNKYPSLPVWLSVPAGTSIVALTNYLDVVADRLKRDASALQQASERVHSASTGSLSDGAAIAPAKYAA
jgi:hypothetical protein